MTLLLSIEFEQQNSPMQSRRESSEASGQKRKMRSPASEKSRKFSGSRHQLRKNAAGLPYEAPWNIKHWEFLVSLNLEALGQFAPCPPLGGSGQMNTSDEKAG